MTSGLLVSHLCFLYLTMCFAQATISKASTSRPPTFAIEPPHRVIFSNSSGAVINCNAVGEPSPKVTWIRADSSPLGHNSPIEATLSGSQFRVARSDGSLLFTPFSASDFRPDVHATTYQCVASNSVGTVVSRTVQVRAGKF